MDTLNISNLVAHHARYRPQASALTFGDLTLDWRQLDARTSRLAHALQAAGVGQGDRVVTVLGNCLEMIDIYWACARMGAVAVPLSPLLMESGLRTLLEDAAPAAIFHSGATAAVTAAASAALACVRVCTGPAYQAFVDGQPATPVTAQVGPDDLYNIMYTSGTTDLPKGIALTHRIRAHYATLMANAFRFTPASVALHTGALVFNGAFVTLLPSLLVGSRFILHPQFDAAAFVDTVERERVTHTMLVPSQLAAILDLPGFDARRLASLEVLLSLGAPLPLAHKERLEAQLPLRLHELYGLTEGFVTILDRADAVAKRGSVGVPPPFFALRIVDEQGQPLPAGATGEIAGQGPFLMPGYYNKPELTAQALRDGWLMTGDLGYVDQDGFLYLVDRKKDMIDSGGVKVYPHAGLEALAALLEASNASAKIVVTDSVFSMDGDLAPLPDMLALCQRHGAWLVVDDAHGFGTLGAHGRGALEHFKLRSPNLVYMGTLGKAAGVGGAFVAAHASVIELMIQRARPYIYTTAAPPALAHALMTSIDIIGGEEGAQRRAHLRSLIEQLDRGLNLKRWTRMASFTAIQPVVIGGNDEALAASAALYQQGLWVPAIRPPTVPAGTARLRATLSAAHTHDEVARLALALNALEEAR